MTICRKCKHSKYLCMGIYKCMVSPRFTQRTDYVVGRVEVPSTIYDFQRCDEVNINGNCPKYEPETSKWRLFWK